MKTPIYCMPGMGASSRIFEHWKDSELYELHLLDWEEPNKRESLEEYAQRIAQKITLPSPILLGVSFGGILVQEIAKIIPDCRGIILVSTIKSEKELPLWMKICKNMKLHYIFPIKWIASLRLWEKTKRYERLYKKYMSITTPNYLSWVVISILNWKVTSTTIPIIHIQGDKDWVFPIKYIKNCITIKGGTHIMTINRFRWFNEHLPILLEHFKV